MVTIPGSAARKLGIDIPAAMPKERLVTAGGVIEAPRIILDTITIDGWTERNIPAYVVDIPEQTGIGLLGLNFLNRFRMDLNTKAGVLTLAPRP
jgi:clan AA aspartic protease (TIGR02281 family)